MVCNASLTLSFRQLSIFSIRLVIYVKHISHFVYTLSFAGVLFMMLVIVVVCLTYYNSGVWMGNSLKLVGFLSRCLVFIVKWATWYTLDGLCHVWLII